LKMNEKRRGPSCDRRRRGPLPEFMAITLVWCACYVGFIDSNGLLWLPVDFGPSFASFNFKDIRIFYAKSFYRTCELSYSLMFWDDLSRVQEQFFFFLIIEPYFE
jgi:hypothetical protein